jgi:tRNA modification GTPase
VAINKGDLPLKVPTEMLQSYFSTNIPMVVVSAKTGLNWRSLEDALAEKVKGSTNVSDVSALIPVNQRHFRWLKKAQEALQNFDRGLTGGMEEVFLAQDVKEAIRALEAIVGTSPEGDVLSQIFQNFCIGK